MERHRILGVIPARIGSARLPRKPLVPLAGRPLIEWVWRRVQSFSGLDAVVVATDSEEVAAACRAAGAAVELTRPTHPSGTDRVAEVAARPGYRDFDIIVNIQGDEPFITEAQVMAAAEQVREGWDVGTVATPVRTLEAWRDPAVVKVARRDDGAALYFSRAPIPFRREGDPSAADLATPRYLRHLGVYAYAPATLARWVALPPGALEEIERLEQLRALAAGLSIGVAVVAAAAGGVDTHEDARRAEEQILAAQGSEPGT
ncbi:MAG TPA: 3-deoxy-manno-octulosonate cytidylyltransferase [Longimicrobiales bacterium]